MVFHTMFYRENPRSIGEMVRGGFLSPYGCKINGDASIWPSGCTHDSRQMQPGWLYFAVPGNRTNGAKYIEQAIATGAIAVVTELKYLGKLGKAHPEITFVRVPSVREVMGLWSAYIWGSADIDLNLVGVTGTNGKTSIAYMASGLLHQLGQGPVATIGTLGYDDGTGAVPTGNTTPEAPLFQQLIKRAADSNCKTVVAEVSSHAMDLQRVDDACFRVVVFSNLSEDHLDHHGDMESYYRAKAKLFVENPYAVAIVCVDTPWGVRLVRHLRARAREEHNSDFMREIITVSATGKRADHYAKNIKCTLDGITYTHRVRGDKTAYEARLKWLGEHNVENALLAAAIADTLYEYDVLTPADWRTKTQKIVAALSQVPLVPGRVEPVPNDAGLHIFIDYAHTPEALASVVAGMRAVSDKPITLMMGVPGDRGKEGWQRLAQAAGENADHVILTEDDMKKGTLAECFKVAGAVLEKSAASWELVENRWSAIGAAVARAKQGEIALICGLGHQKTLISEGYNVIEIDEIAAAKLAISGGDPSTLDPRNR
ncbi:MAG: UDP-N-acetylmuramoyl-L-alanyl-D-glutamate--2,6-diaminopimelate ligase [Microbacteriaceae bacterium]|nr:UDP-N-acetylmuramoyl-L-alanyl-D-glutamate--2,6-diaminopimelate ligase [Microbacteriaceae bacterium]